MTKKEKTAYTISIIACLVIGLLGIAQVECLRTVEAVTIFAGSFGAGASLVAGLTKWRASAKNQQK